MDYETLIDVEINVEEYDPIKGQNTLDDPKYDWSNKITDGIGEDQ